MIQTTNSIMHFAKELISVDSSATIEKIVTQFKSNVISLLPIIDHKKKKNTGLIRRRKMWDMMVKKLPIESINDLKEEPLPEISIDDSLFDAITKLKSVSAILVRNKNKEYTHLITPRVVANALEEYAERFKEIEILEDNLKKVIKELPQTELKKFEDEFDTELERMDFSNYTKILSKYWETLSIKNYDKKLFTKLLDESREYRNALMHFRLEEKNDGLKSLKKLNRLFLS